MQRYTECPICGSEISVTLVYEPYDASINYGGCYLVEDHEQTCACALTADQEEALWERLETNINSNPANF